MVFGFIECYAIIAWSVLVFFQWTAYNAGSDRSWYTKKKQSWMPPGWVFPIAWTLLYSALVIMMFYFTLNTPADSWQIITGLVLFLVNIYFNKEWSVAFWDRQNPSAAFYILFLGMLPTSLALYFPFILGNTVGLYYVPVIMVTLYNAWCVYALVLNYYWIEE